MNEAVLKEKYNLSADEFIAIKNRCNNLIDFEEKSGAVIGRCNGNNHSNRRYFRKIFNGDFEKTRHCISFLEKYGGMCNCEILFNVVPEIENICKEIDYEEKENEASI